MKLLFRINVLLFSIFCSSQEAFELGFYIDNQGKQIDGFINNENWFNTPDFIFFKAGMDAEAEKLTLQSIRSFEINGSLKFERYTVQVDGKPNSNYKDRSNSNFDPVYTTKTVFLKVIVEGDASLLQYTHSGNSYYYCKMEKTGKVLPLVYKSFIDSNGRERENIDFRKVLFENVNCNAQDIDGFLKVKYNANELLQVFEDYNKCKESTFKVYKEKKKKSKFNVTAFVGYGFSSYKIPAPVKYGKESTSSPVFGGELSMILPHKNYRYEIFTRIYYQNIDAHNFSEKVTTGFSTSYTINDVKSDFSTANVLLGSRYNFFIDEGKNKLFLDASFGVSFVSGEITYTATKYTSSDNVEFIDTVDLITKSAIIFNLGFGYVFNDKFGIDLRYDLADTGNIAKNSRKVENKKNNLTTSLRYTFL